VAALRILPTIGFPTSPPEQVFPKQVPSVPIPDWTHAQTSRDLLETEKIVKLEMNQDSVIGRISFLAQVGDHWCVLDDEQRRVLRFDAAGHYLDTVGARGQGPGEYEWPCSLSRWGPACSDPAGRGSSTWHGLSGTPDLMPKNNRCLDVRTSRHNWRPSQKIRKPQKRPG